jgi:hypothetical protein
MVPDLTKCGGQGPVESKIAMMAMQCIDGREQEWWKIYTNEGAGGRGQKHSHCIGG